MIEELPECIAQTNIKNNLKKNGYKVLSDARLSNFTKRELIIAIRMLENNWSNKIEQSENIRHYAEQHITGLEAQIERMKCCANCKSFKGYGETCEGWGEPVLNLNCDCTEWELKE